MFDKTFFALTYAGRPRWCNWNCSHKRRSRVRRHTWTSCMFSLSSFRCVCGGCVPKQFNLNFCCVFFSSRDQLDLLDLSAPQDLVVIKDPRYDIPLTYYYSAEQFIVKSLSSNTFLVLVTNWVIVSGRVILVHRALLERRSDTYYTYA